MARIFDSYHFVTYNCKAHVAEPGIISSIWFVLRNSKKGMLILGKIETSIVNLRILSPNERNTRDFM